MKIQVDLLTVTFSYKSDPEIKAMTDLVDAYQRREVHSAEKILRGEYLLSQPERH